MPTTDQGAEETHGFPQCHCGTSPEVGRLLTIWPRHWAWIWRNFGFDSTRWGLRKEAAFSAGVSEDTCIWMKEAAGLRDGVSELSERPECEARHVVFQEKRWGSSLSGLATSTLVSRGESPVDPWKDGANVGKACRPCENNGRWHCGALPRMAFVMPRQPAVDAASLAVASVLTGSTVMLALVAVTPPPHRAVASNKLSLSHKHKIEFLN